MIKRIVSILLALAIALPCALFFGGCKEEEYPVTVAGMLIEKRPEHIVCLSNKLTEIIVDMGYTSLLSGRSADCTLTAVQYIDVCGTAEQPSGDVLVSMGCDLLIVGTESPTEELVALAEQGIPILQLLTPYDRLTFLNLYRCLGAAMNGRVQGYNDGDAAATKILVQLDDVDRAVSGESAVTVCVYTDGAMTKAITGDMLGNMVIELAGGFNVAVEGKRGNVTMSRIASGNPDVILCRLGDETTVLAQRALDKSGALKYNRIYGYDTEKLFSLGSDLVTAAWEMARLMHPELIDASVLPGDAKDYLPSHSGVVIDGGQAYQDYIAEQEALAAAKKEEQS